MKHEIDAIYENGQFRPLVPLDLPEHHRVVLTVESGVADDWLDREVMEWASAEGDPSISLEEVRQRLAAIKGSLADTVISERGEY